MESSRHRQNNSNRVVLYMYGVPRKSSSGAYLRFYSPELPVTWTHVVATPPPRSVMGALMYRMYRPGYPGEAAAAYYFARHGAVPGKPCFGSANIPAASISSPHNFRNHFAIEHLLKGTPIEDVARLLGPP